MFKKILLILIMSYSTIAFGATISDPPVFDWGAPKTDADGKVYYSGVLEYGEVTFY
jgi:hypothetical protein